MSSSSWFSQALEAAATVRLHAAFSEGKRAAAAAAAANPINGDALVFKRFVNVFDDAQLRALRERYAAITALQMNPSTDITRGSRVDRLLFANGFAAPQKVADYAAQTWGMQPHEWVSALVAKRGGNNQPWHTDSDLPPGHYATLIVSLEELNAVMPATQFHVGDAAQALYAADRTGILSSDVVGDADPSVDEAALDYMRRVPVPYFTPILGANEGYLFDGRLYHRGITGETDRPGVIYMVFTLPGVRDKNIEGSDDGDVDDDDDDESYGAKRKKAPRRAKK